MGQSPGIKTYYESLGIRKKLSTNIRKIMRIQNDSRATSQIDTDLFTFLLVTPFRQHSVNSLEKRSVKSFSK